MANQASGELGRYVDMWAVPEVHPTNVELLQKLKTADSQQFTKNMDVVGTVADLHPDSRRWEKTHLIGIRNDIWRPDERELTRCLKAIKKKRQKEMKKRTGRSAQKSAKQSKLLEEQIAHDEIMQTQSEDLERRRLVLKLFKTTGTRVRWCGTIEEVTTTETYTSIGSNRSLLTMVVMLPRTELVTYIQQNHRTFRIPSVFTFGFYDKGRMWHLSLKRRWVSIGPDYDIEADGDTIGLLDGKLLSLGSDSHLQLDEHPLADSTQFVDLLTLFASSMGYHRAMRRSVKRRVKATRSGQWHCHIIEDEELRLRQNARAAA